MLNVDTTRAASGSCYAGAEVAQEAVVLLRPMIEAVLDRPALCGSGVVALVLMDPAMRPPEAAFEHAVLHACSFGKPAAQWDADYLGFARAKAAVAWRLQCSGDLLHELQPYRLREGDSLLRGAVLHQGIVVAASGAEAVFDEAIAVAVAATFAALARQRHSLAREGRDLVAVRGPVPFDMRSC